MVKNPVVHLDPEPQRAVGCPFSKCATKPPKLGLLNVGGDYWVYCKGCSASGPHGHNELEAVQFWNDRNLTAPPAPPSKPGVVARVFWWIVIFFTIEGLTR